MKDATKKITRLARKKKKKSKTHTHTYTHLTKGLYPKCIKKLPIRKQTKMGRRVEQIYKWSNPYEMTFNIFSQNEIISKYH